MCCRQYEHVDSRVRLFGFSSPFFDDSPDPHGITADRDVHGYSGRCSWLLRLEFLMSNRITYAIPLSSSCGFLCVSYTLLALQRCYPMAHRKTSSFLASSAFLAFDVANGQMSLSVRLSRLDFRGSVQMMPCSAWREEDTPRIFRPGAWTWLYPNAGGSALLRASFLHLCDLSNTLPNILLL